MKYYYIFLLLPLFLLTSCDPDDPDDVNEEEVITNLTYTLIPDGGGAEVVLSFEDLDGDGGNAPVITGGTLQANTTYNGMIELSNQSEMPFEDITEEVREEGDEHQFFFTLNNITLQISYEDFDGDMNPVGLATTLVTTAAGQGTLTLILRHEPDKSGERVAEGDPTNAGGETDIEVTFPVEVQ